jgi:hypothetical protein
MATADLSNLKVIIQQKKDDMRLQAEKWHRLYGAYNLGMPGFKTDCRAVQAFSRFKALGALSAMDAQMAEGMALFERMKARLSEAQEPEFEDKDSYSALQDIKRTLDNSKLELNKINEQFHQLQDALASSEYQARFSSQLKAALFANKGLMALHQHKLSALHRLYRVDPSCQDASEWNGHYRALMHVKDAHKQLAVLIATVADEEECAALTAVCKEQSAELEALTGHGALRRVSDMSAKIAAGRLDWHAVRELQTDPYIQLIAGYEPPLKAALEAMSENMLLAFSGAVIDRSRQLMLAASVDEILDLKNKANPNFKKITQNFNGLVRYVKTDIVREHNMDFRVKAIEQWVCVAKRCEASEDYSSLMAIHSALKEILRPDNKLTHTVFHLDPEVQVVMKKHDALLKKPNLNKLTPYLGKLRATIERLKVREGEAWRESAAIGALMDEYQSHRETLREKSITASSPVMDLVMATEQPADFYSKIRAFAATEARLPALGKGGVMVSHFKQIENTALRAQVIEQQLNVGAEGALHVIKQLNEAQKIPMKKARLGRLLGRLSLTVSGEQLARIHRENMSVCDAGILANAHRHIADYEALHSTLKLGAVRDHIKAYAYFVKGLEVSKITATKLADHILEIAIIPAGKRVTHPVFQDFKALKMHKAALVKVRDDLVVLKEQVVEVAPVALALSKVNAALAFYAHEKVKKYDTRLSLLESWATNVKQKVADEDRAFRSGTREREMILSTSSARKNTPVLAEKIAEFADKRPLKNRLKRISDRQYFDSMHQSISSSCVDTAYESVIRIHAEEYKPALDRLHALLQEKGDVNFDVSAWTAWKNTHSGDVAGLMDVDQSLRSEVGLHKIYKAFRELQSAHKKLAPQFVQLNHMYSHAHPGKTLSHSDLARSIKRLCITQQINVSAKYFSVSVRGQSFKHISGVNMKAVSALLAYHNFSEGLTKQIGTQKSERSAALHSESKATLKGTRTRIQSMAGYAKEHPFKAVAGAVVLGSVAAVAHVPILAGVVALKGAVAVKAAVAIKVAAGAAVGSGAVSAAGSRRQERRRATAAGLFSRAAPSTAADRDATFEFTNPLHERRTSAPVMTR